MYFVSKQKQWVKDRRKRKNQKDMKKHVQAEHKKQKATSEANPNNRRNYWAMVKARKLDILEYGMQTGIITRRKFKTGAVADPSKLSGNEEENNPNTITDTSKQDKIILQLGSTTVQFIEAAIPFLPIQCAMLCLLCNILFPGLGTVISGFSALCMGQTNLRNYPSANRKPLTVIGNLFVGISQLVTIPFFLVGWFWSIAWGGKLIIQSNEYRRALEERRREIVAKATAATINEHFEETIQARIKRNVFGKNDEHETKSVKHGGDGAANLKVDSGEGLPLDKLQEEFKELVQAEINQNEHDIQQSYYETRKTKKQIINAEINMLGAEKQENKEI